MGLCDEGYKFSFSAKGRILTITRIDEDGGWDDGFRRRSTEIIPDFTSTVYTHHGLDHEDAPYDTMQVIFAPSVTNIGHSAFSGCSSLERITIPDTVTHIGEGAFFECHSLKSIRFSTNLVHIVRMAFAFCESLEAVFLPPTVAYIGDDTFHGCKSLRFLHVPETIEHFGNRVFNGCDRLVSTTVSNNLSKVCYSTSITPQTIQECIDTHGIELATEVDDQLMMALHIICANPHVTGDCIRAYLQLAPEAANVQDGIGMTGLHILWSLPYLDTHTGDAIRAYLNLAPDAANVQDLKGKTPFQYLCKSNDTFLDDRNFSALMAWWYNFMP